MPETRRLAAIMAADVAGYSRLMEADETGTLRRLKAHQAAIFPIGEAHGGRIVGTAGDGLLVEFPSVVEAVNAAMRIQATMAERNDDVPEAEKMLFRIGINLGDVIVADDGDIFGTGVNVAARLEGQATPGGLCISQSVHEQVRDQLDFEFENAGEIKVKNIARPVHAWRWPGNLMAYDVAQIVVSGMAPPLPRKPSIVVLPFENLSSDPDQDYFCEGVTEDIITELSRFQSLFVISPNTSFNYRGKHVDIRSVARELGVHFVIRGSVRRVGGRVRISAQLIDGEEDRQLWANRFEDGVEDIFVLQERMSREIASTAVPEIEYREMHRTASAARRFTAADDLSWRAYRQFNDSCANGDEHRLRNAIELAQRAVGEDPDCTLAIFTLVLTHNTIAGYGLSEDPEGDFQKARIWVGQLMTAAPSDSRSYLARGIVDAYRGEARSTLSDLRLAHELNPNDFLTLVFLSMTEAAGGEIDSARQLAAKAIRSSPKDYWIDLAYMAFSIISFRERDFQEMYRWAERSIPTQHFAPVRRLLAMVAASETGDFLRAKQLRDGLETSTPGFLPSVRDRGLYYVDWGDEDARLFDECLARTLEPTSAPGGEATCEQRS